MNRPQVYISDGESGINLIRAGNGSALSAVDGGFGSLSISTHAFDAHVRDNVNLRFNERWILVAAENCTDKLAENIQKLIKMFRLSSLRENKLRYTRDVYLIERSTGESNFRYAKVYRVPALNIPHPVFDNAFEQARVISNFGISIERGIWRAGVPGVLPNVMDIDKTDGPTDPTSVLFANYEDDHEIDTIFTFGNGGTGFSANLIATAAHNMFTDGVTGDLYYIGSDEPFWLIAWLLVTAGVYTSTTFTYEYSDGGAGWPDLTIGDDLMLYPDQEPWNGTGIASLHAHPGDDWATEDVNGDVKFWIRIRLTMGGVWTTSPANGTVVVYNQHTPEIRIPATSLRGDVPPFILKRMKSPDGGDEDNTMCSMSRIIAGLKSNAGGNDLDGFNSRLNCGGDGLPAGWAVAYGSDTASVPDPEAPGGDRADCTFATQTISAMRVRFTGTDKLRDHAGEYRVFLRYNQTEGDKGDLEFKLRVRIDSIANYAPAFETGEVEGAGTYDHVLVDMIKGDTLLLPFLEVVNADDLDADLIFEIWVKLVAGAADVELLDLIFIPAGEWIADLNDPISDPTLGTSALRGLNILDIDSGILDNRTIKQIIDGAEITPVGPWSRRSSPIEIEPGLDTRLYYLIGYYTDGWGEGPFLAENMQGFLAELYSQACYFYLRGAD